MRLRAALALATLCALGGTAGLVGPAVAGALPTTAAVAAAPQPDPRPLTLETLSDRISIGDPAFSPDGRSLLVRSDRDGRQRLWVLARDGSDARPLLADDAPAREGAWSPDGRRVAVVRRVDGRSDIWVVDRDGGGLRRVTDDPGDERALAWSPDGSSIAFISGRTDAQDLHLVEVEGGRVRQLTEETNPWDDYRWAPAWSPDGRRIAYVSNRAGTYRDDLWVVEVESGRSRMLTSYVQVVSTPVWSPDGRWIAFNSVERNGLWYHEMSDIHLYDVERDSVRKLPLNAYVSDRFSTFRMAWAPDGRSLFFRYEWEGNANLWRVGVEGGVATKMTYQQGSFGNFTVSPDGEAIAFVRSTPTRDAEVHVMDLRGGAPVPITAWQAPFEGIAAPERIAFRSRDGLYILGYLYRPPDFDPGARYPALVQVHGGGNNAFGNGFHPLEQWLAANGFVVLAIEYRGSAGHGREFQDLSMGEFGAEQGWDAAAAARYLRELPYTNGKIGIYGGSYGGIMTMSAVTRDSRPFDAAAPFYGIYDWEDAFRNADRLAQLMIINGHRGFTPDENPELYEHTASIRHLDRVRRDLPFLIIHGELDRRAPFRQSERLAAALRRRGNPVIFHAYPDEAHGFRLPENRRHAYGALLDFFRTHLSTTR